MGPSPRQRSRTATDPARRVALLPATGLDDPTYRRVAQGLGAALREQGWLVRTFCPRRSRLAALRRMRPGVLHLHCAGHVEPGALRWVGEGLRLGGRLVLTFQDLGHPDLPRPGRAARRALAGLASRADRVTALTRGLAARVRLAFPAAKPVAVVGNGVGPAWFRRPGRGAGRGIVAASRLAPYKGVDLLLWAFRGLLEREPSARLTVFGRDFLGGHHRRLALALGLGDRVRFAGDASAGTLRRALRRARFFVSASRRETYGMAVFEALAAGAPVLATRTGAAAAALRHRRDAWLVPPGDAAALERGMRALWSSPGLRRRLSLAGRAAAAKELWGARAEAYAGIYAGALARRR